jgi:cytochrome c biogenesis protein CcmG/thiol:disulfide interchange protein DsbE
MKLRYLLPLILFVVIAVFLAVGLNLNPRDVPSPLIDKPVPQFSLPTLQRVDQQISDKDFMGKVTLLNVWASWCSGCRVEHPLLLDIVKNHHVNLVGLDYKDHRRDAMQWLSRHGNPYRVIAFDLDGRVGIDWGVYGVPETFVIDKQGVIRYKHTGPLTRDVLQNKLLPMLRQLEGVSS